MWDTQVVAALIGASFTLLVGAVAAVVAVSSSKREHSAALIIAALEHMSGGSQERGAGLAALRALRALETSGHGSWSPWRRISRSLR